MTATEDRKRAVMEELEARADPAQKSGMARFGIATDKALGGIPVPYLRTMARKLGRDHALAVALWDTDVHEARMLACFVDDPHQVTEEQMERWVAEFHSWDICDQCCSNLFDRTDLAWSKVGEWTAREEEFVRRAGFVLMACLAVHDKKAPDRRFLELLPLIEEGADDERNFVKKAVNWALRQIGKRDRALNEAAVACGERIQKRGTTAARWIAADALRELRSEAVQARLGDREGRKARSSQ